MADELLRDPEIRSAWGVSPDQYLQLREAWVNVHDARMQDPEFRKIQELMNDVDVPGMRIRGFDEVTLGIAYAQSRRSNELMTIRISNAFDNTLTPEQRQTMNEAFLASMSELPIILPDMFEALDLTDDQKQQMNEIKNNLEAEFEKMLDEFVTHQMMLRDMLIVELGGQEIETVGTDFTRDETLIAFSRFREKTQTATKRMADAPEYRRILDEMQSSGMAFSTQFRTQMFDVLTDEQWQRLQNLIDNPPPHARVLIAKLREQRGETEKNESGVWVPGPGSWRPGDPIPEAYRQERNTERRFPRPQ